MIYDAMKQCIVTLFVLMMVLAAHAQGFESKDIPALLDSMDREVIHALRVTGYPMPKHIKAFNVLYGMYDGRTSKTAISKGRFARYFELVYYSNPERLFKLRAEVHLCDPEIQGIVTHDGFCFRRYHPSLHKYLIEQMMRLGLRHVCCFMNVCGLNPIYWGIGNDGESYVILPHKEQTYLVDDYPDELWDKLFMVKNDPQFNIERAKMPELK